MPTRTDVIDASLINCQIEAGLRLAASRVPVASLTVINTNFNSLVDLDPEGSDADVEIMPAAEAQNVVFVLRNVGSAGLLSVYEDTDFIVHLNPGDSVALRSDGDSWAPVLGGSGGAKKSIKIPLVAATDTTPGGVVSWANPEGVDILVTRAILVKETGSSGAATVDVGVAADGTTSSDTLFDGQSLQNAGVFDSAVQHGTNGSGARVVADDEFITATASATAAGLVGYLYLEYTL